MSMPVPTEDVESMSFARWCRDRGLRFGHVNNEMYSTSWKQKSRTLDMGTAKGFPDYIVLVSRKQSKDGRGYVLLPEMKRQRGAHPSTRPNQREWIAAINLLKCDQVISLVCYGAEEAKAFVSHYLSEQALTPGEVF